MEESMTGYSTGDLDDLINKKQIAPILKNKQRMFETPACQAEL